MAAAGIATTLYTIVRDEAHNVLACGVWRWGGSCNAQCLPASNTHTDTVGVEMHTATEADRCGHHIT